MCQEKLLEEEFYFSNVCYISLSFTQIHISTAQVTFILLISIKYLFYTTFSVVSHERETLPVFVREEDRLRLSEERVLRNTRIFRPKRKNDKPDTNYTLGNSQYVQKH
jgi:hypothetical protein